MKNAVVGVVILVAALRCVYGQETQRLGESVADSPNSVVPEKLSDDQLRQALRESQSGWNDEGKQDRILTEVIRRGGELWERSFAFGSRPAKPNRTPVGHSSRRILPPSEKKGPASEPPPVHVRSTSGTTRMRRSHDRDPPNTEEA